ncbi:hypothetical protein UCRPA7_403 [Phaeoacremonium minimum UCRPA7]|uniref:Heme haloperoxidase family profile domain-containing protein n=1 Tax=Phaeoacremonium minimum (strain UCR-PA7) TaxID=1286976 RepID=R8BXK1_PHAM7|nr:hypothetical protein UCRPA7_403 [Phaeoacremonium minimum UCRPA7]EOO04072.1 hypothetical protein UCRPA7_403 [Phaeoacremonium minimum UCRPA7]
MAHRLRLYQDEKEKYVTVESAAKARAARVKDAMAANPTFNASAAQQLGTYGTTGLYLATVWDHDAGAAPKKWVKAFFEEERIAFKRPQVLKTQEFLSNMTLAVRAVQV